MTIREIPRLFEYVCDVCGAEHRQEPGSTGHYTQSTPPGWLSLKYWRAATEPRPSNGRPVPPGDAHKSMEPLLCVICRQKFDQWWYAELKGN